MKRPYGSTATGPAKSSESISPFSIHRKTFARASPARQFGARGRGSTLERRTLARPEGRHPLGNRNLYRALRRTGCLHGFAIVTRDDKAHKRGLAQKRERMQTLFHRVSAGVLVSGPKPKASVVIRRRWICLT